MRNPLLTSAAAALLAGAPLLAQVPNDDCTGAIPVNLGPNGPFTNVGATSDPSIPMPCGSPGNDNDVWFTFLAPCTASVTASLCGADYDCKIQIMDGSCGSLTSIVCLDDSCGLQTEVNFNTIAGTTYYIRVGGFNNSTGNFPLNLSCAFGIRMQAVAEPTPGAGTLSETDGLFTDNDFLRFNYTDTIGIFNGRFGATVINVGNGGAPAVGVSTLIPGFSQLWAGSTPAGQEYIYGPAFVGAPDQSVQIPPGVFSGTDTLRLQAIVLDRNNAPGQIPVVPSENVVSFVYQAPPPTCTISEGFEGLSSTVGNYPSGWSNGAGTQQWRPNTGGTSSSTTGPTSARFGSTYMYTETSSPVAVGDIFEMRSATYTDQTVSHLNFYLSRIGSDIGLLDVFIDDGTTLTPLASFNGPDPIQSQGGVEWIYHTAALPSPLPASYSFVFRYTTPPVVQFTFYGDCAIDQFCLN